MNFFELAGLNVLRNKPLYLTYFFCCLVSTFLFFGLLISIVHPVTYQEKFSGTKLTMLMLVGNSIIYIVSFIILYFATKRILTSKYPQFEVLIQLGAQRKQIMWLFFIEMIAVGIVSIILGIGLGLIFSQFFLLLSNKILSESHFFFYIPISAVIETFEVYLFMVIIVSLAVICKLFNFKKDRVRLKKIVQVGLFYSNIGILIISYYFSAVFHHKKGFGFELLAGIAHLIFYSSLFLFLYYCLYWIMKIVFKRLKKSNYFFESGKMLLYSRSEKYFKENKVEIFLLCLLYTISFLAIVIPFYDSQAFFNKVEHYPFQYSYLKKSEAPINDQNSQIIEDQLKKQEGYQKVSFPVLTEDNERSNFSDIGILSNTSYNKIAKIINLSSAHLRDNQAWLSENEPSPNLMKFKKSEHLTIEKRFSKNERRIESYLFKQLLVVSDEKYQSIRQDSSFKEYITENFTTSNWKINSDVNQRLDETLLFKGNEQFESFRFVNLSKMYLSRSSTLLFVRFVLGILAFLFLLIAVIFTYFKIYSIILDDYFNNTIVISVFYSKKEFSKIMIAECSYFVFIPVFLAFLFSSIVLLREQSMSIIAVSAGVLLKIILIQLILFKIINTKIKKITSNSRPL